jgi:hypothetical protein
VGKGKETYTVTQNNSGVEDPQYLSDFMISWQKLGKNRPEPARQPYITLLRPLIGIMITLGTRYIIRLTWLIQQCLDSVYILIICILARTLNNFIFYNSRTFAFWTYYLVHDVTSDFRPSGVGNILMACC